MMVEEEGSQKIASDHLKVQSTVDSVVAGLLILRHEQVLKAAVAENGPTVTFRIRLLTTRT